MAKKQLCDLSTAELEKLLHKTEIHLKHAIQRGDTIAVKNIEKKKEHIIYNLENRES